MKYLVFIGALAASFCASAITATKAYVDRRDAETLAAATNLVITSDEVMPGKGELWKSSDGGVGVKLTFPDDSIYLLLTPQYILMNSFSLKKSTVIDLEGISLGERRYMEDSILTPEDYQMYFPKISQDETFATRSDIERATNNIPQVVTNVVRAVVEGEISPDNAAFSNAVLSVGIGIDTNAVAAINALLDGEDNALPVGDAATVGGLLAALAAALAALKKKVMEKYPFVDTAIVDGVVTLTPFSRNALTSDGTAFTVAMGGGTNNYLRDCVFVVTAGETAPTITWGDNFHPRTDADTDFACVAGTTNVYWISEYANGEFVVAGWQETEGGNA